MTRCLSLDAYKIGIDGMSLVVSASSANQDLMRPNLMLYGIPDDWIERYQEQMYSAIDPVIQHCLKTEVSTSWQEAYLNCGKGFDAFIDEAQQFGMVNGYAIGKKSHSYSGTASITSFSVGDSKISLNQEIMIQTVLPHLNEILTRPSFLITPHLTNREQEVLQWAHVGKTQEETSNLLKVSESTVKFHLHNVYKKLNAANKIQAISAALKLGIIDLE
ncbi:MAG TPA: hypothetical protein HPP65_01850 [Gammaproteobacteria bacterium]|nr:hypothetical protein [Gammaproteobacteria bacterium]HIJ33132.1 hypothetical protein [Gammaproteobacteria bacterium]